jgi:hypothetical protein
MAKTFSAMIEALKAAGPAADRAEAMARRWTTTVEFRAERAAA